MVCDHCILSVPVDVGSCNDGILMVFDDKLEHRTENEDTFLDRHVHFVVVVCFKGENESRETFQTFFEKISLKDINKSVSFSGSPNTLDDSSIMEWFVKLFDDGDENEKIHPRDVSSVQTEFQYQEENETNSCFISLLVKRKGDDGLSRIIYSGRLLKEETLNARNDCFSFKSLCVHSIYKLMLLVGSSLKSFKTLSENLKRELDESNTMLDNWKKTALSLSEQRRLMEKERLENFAILINKKNEMIVKLKEDLDHALKAKESLSDELTSIAKLSQKRKRSSIQPTVMTTVDDNRADQPEVDDEQIELLAKGKQVELIKLSDNFGNKNTRDKSESFQPRVNELGAIEVSSVNQALDDGESTSSEILL